MSNDETITELQSASFSQLPWFADRTYLGFLCLQLWRLFTEAIENCCSNSTMQHTVYELKY